MSETENLESIAKPANLAEHPAFQLLRFHWDDVKTLFRAEMVSKLISEGQSIRFLARELKRDEKTIRIHLEIASLDDDGKRAINAGKSVASVLRDARNQGDMPDPESSAGHDDADFTAGASADASPRQGDGLNPARESLRTNPERHRAWYENLFRELHEGQKERARLREQARSMYGASGHRAGWPTRVK